MSELDTEIAFKEEGSEPEESRIIHRSEPEESTPRANVRMPPGSSGDIREGDL